MTDDFTSWPSMSTVSTAPSVVAVPTYSLPGVEEERLGWAVLTRRLVHRLALGRVLVRGTISADQTSGRGWAEKVNDERRPS